MVVIAPPCRSGDTDDDDDGVDDGDELALGTDPARVDSDGDGLWDGWEVLLLDSDPLVGD